MTTNTLTCPAEGCDRTDFNSNHALGTHLRRGHGWSNDEVREHLADPAPVEHDDAVTLHVVGSDLDDIEDDDIEGLPAGVQDIVDIVAWLYDREPQDVVDEALTAWAEQMRNDSAVRAVLDARASYAAAREANA
jgi:hypothetical protein